MRKRDLVIVGAGGLARAVASHFRKQYTIKAFIDTPRTPHETLNNIPVDTNKFTLGANAVIVIGDPKRKQQAAQQYQNILRFKTLIHPTAVVSPHAEIGYGCVICPYVVIDPNTIIGNHVYLDHHVAVGHDAVVGDYTMVCPLTLIGGYTQLGEGIGVGTGSSIVKEVHIGEWSIIGAGAVVTKDVPPRSVMVGVPAHKIRDVP